jgi:hypothetical protein
MERTPAFSRRYGIAVGSTVLALLMMWLVRPLPAPLPGLILLTAVIGSAAYGGLGPGLLATACSLLGLQALVLPPTYVQFVPITQSLRLGIFGAVACTCSVLLAV